MDPNHVELGKPSPSARALARKSDMIKEVTIFQRNAPPRKVKVQISFPTQAKPNLGGFFDKRTEKTFYHAQTGMEKVTKVLRESQQNVAVQAYNARVKEAQTLVSVGQQMELEDYYVSEVRDEVRYPRPYETYEMLMLRKNKAATVIQKYWRRFLARRDRARRMDGLLKRIKWAEKIRIGRLLDRKAIMDKEIERQENPTKMVDLELLYRGINAWRKEQEEWINQNRWGAERKAALSTLTELECDLLLDLERARNRIKVQERENRIQAHFDKMGQPKRFLAEKSEDFIITDDEGKAYVRRLQRIYSKLRAPVENTPEGIKARCSLLSKLNNITSGVNTKVSQMLTELVTRELNFIREKKVGHALLAGVRHRVASTFYILCQDPKFNPESKKAQKIPYDFDQLRNSMFQCKGCRRMMSKDEFTVVRGTTVTSRCKACMNLYRTAILRVDLNLYRHMLKELRREELAAGVVNSVTFLIDAFDLQFLVDQIWHGQSALSGIDNRYLLRLCRWEKEHPWAPWNCVLLTDEEAMAHLHLDKLEDAYTPTFFHKVFVKQATAKTYFEGIAKLLIGLDERVRENCKIMEAKNKKAAELRARFRKKVKVLAMAL